MSRPKNLLLRVVATLTAGLGLTFAVASFAGAATPQPVSPGELSKATTAAKSSDALRLLAKVPGSAKAAATVGSDARPVYALNPAFVREASAPVATFWYAATSASKGGQSLTVYTTPDATGAWHAVNVASGDTEARMSAAARGALVFTEPQIGAWYALTGTQVRPLNASAVKSIGSAPVTVAAYQDLVAGRYSDKLPGSSYSDEGMAGGYDTTAAASSGGSYSDFLYPTAGAAGLLVLGLFLYRRFHSA
jgi:hypothetical protein